MRLEVDPAETQTAPEQRAGISITSQPQSVWARLKTHKVAQWTLAYAAVAYTLLHGTQMVRESFEWPHLVVRVITLLLFLGLPLVATLAWYHGHRGRQRMSRAELVIITVLLVIAGTLLWQFARPAHAPAAAQQVTPSQAPLPLETPVAAAPSAKSIAVLPFADMSEKKDQEYFADGMAEEIINRLSQAPHIYVPARTSSFFFKGKPTQIPEVAKQLHVAHVLEGSVRTSGNQLRLTAQLIRATDGYHVWSQTYDRGLRDVFKVQDEIANAVVEALQIGFEGGPLTRPNGGTQNLEAYELYLRGVSLHRDNTQKSIEEAGPYLEQAVKLDPDFGLAWKELSWNFKAKGEARLLPLGNGFERARELLQHALQMSPEMGEAYSDLAYIDMTYDFNWTAAATALQRAKHLEPDNAQVLLIAGILSTNLGQWDDAVRQLRLAEAHDPLSSMILVNLGTALYGARRYAQAEVSLRQLLAQAPDFLWTRYYLTKALLLQGKHKEALTQLADVIELDRIVLLPIVLQAAGRRAEADKAFGDLLARRVDAYYVAMVYAYRNEPDPAFRALGQAYDQKNNDLQEILGEPLFDNIVHDPRYTAFLRKMKLTE
jgi:TolB-like protein/Tfp pilus assembly protein PilF